MARKKKQFEGRDAQEVLVTELLPVSLEKIKELFDHPVTEKRKDVRTGRMVDKLNIRMISLQTKAAIGVVNAVIKLEDQSLKRKAGGQLDALLAAIRRAKPEAFAIQAIESSALPAPLPDRSS